MLPLNKMFLSIDFSKNYAANNDNNKKTKPAAQLFFKYINYIV